MHKKLHEKLFAIVKLFLKPLLAACLVITLVLGQADGAFAARSGGRIGGGSFRMPSRPSAPSRSYAPPGGGYFYPGGGFGFPFVIPIFGMGGGLFTLLIFITIAGFLVRTFRSVQGEGDSLGYSTPSSTVSVAKLQVGLLAEARGLQADLDRLATVADTSSAAGLSQVLQETTVALLRHPEYWAYGGSEAKQTSLQAAENQFNRLSLTERSKFSQETLSNVNSLLKQANAKKALPEGSGQLATLPEGLAEDPAEYIVVTVLVATQGKLQLPAINSAQDLRQAIGQIGGASGENLLAAEVLWTPQAEGDTLSAEDMLVEYPTLKLI